MSFFTTYSKKLENLIAGILFLLTFAIYFSTMAPTVSFWDTGEFIATSHILGIPHPPGSPLFLLIGKLFTLIPISADIAFRMNIFSPLISAATISLLFFICNEFIEVYVKCPLDVCEERDTKGLYKKARAGEVKDFTGISAPYEEPLNPELTIDSSKLTVEESTRAVLNYLEEKGYVKF